MKTSSRDTTGSGVAPIHVHQVKGYDAIIEFLVDHNAIINVIEENSKQSALHMAILGNVVRMPTDLWGNKLNAAEVLIKAGGQAIINLQDCEGKTRFIVRPLQIITAAGLYELHIF